MGILTWYICNNNFMTSLNNIYSEDVCVQSFIKLSSFINIQIILKLTTVLK